MGEENGIVTKMRAEFFYAFCDVRTNGIFDLIFFIISRFHTTDVCGAECG